MSSATKLFPAPELNKTSNISKFMCLLVEVKDPPRQDYAGGYGRGLDANPACQRNPSEAETGVTRS
jgi:hypothetical protein